MKLKLEKPQKTIEQDTKEANLLRIQVLSGLQAVSADYWYPEKPWISCMEKIVHTHGQM